MNIFRKLVCMFFLLIIMSRVGLCVTGLPFPDAPCPAGSSGVNEFGGFCMLDYEAPQAIWGGGAHFSASGDTASNFVSFDLSYVPYSGDWKLTAYLCAKEGTCTRKSAMNTVDTGVRYLHVNELIAKQMVAFPPGESKSIAYSFSMCMALTGKYGDIWKPSEDDAVLFCSDARPLPDNPSGCIVNPVGDLEINFGEVERDNIKYSSEGEQIKKTVPIVCSGEETQNAILKFDFNPVTINGGESVSVSTEGLGVKVYFDGKPAFIDDNINISLSPGENNFTMGFSLIRDSTIPLSKIKTGVFSASMVVIVTSQ